MQLTRGRVYAAVLGDYGEKLYLVVSNNRRNQALRRALVVRLTTSARPRMPSIVELDRCGAFTGRVCCDEIEYLYPDEARRDAGALTRGEMTRVEDGLRAALGLR